MRRQLVPALTYSIAAFAVLLSFGTGGELGVPGARGTHVWDSMWALEQWADAMFSGRRPWVTEDINYPDGGLVWIGDPLGATLMAPVVWAFGAAAALSTLIWLQLLLAGWVTHRFAAEFLVWRRGGGARGWGPYVAGLSMVLAPILVTHIHNGETSALWVGWTVLAVWLGWRAASDPAPLRLALASGAFVLAGVADWYGGMIAGCFLAAIVLVGTHPMDSPWNVGRWAPLLAGALLLSAYGLLVAPIAGAPDAVDAVQSVDQIRALTRSHGAADPLTYVAVGDYRSPDYRVVSSMTYRVIHGHYLGWVLIALAGWSFVRRRRNTAFLWLGSAFCCLLSLGPVLVTAGKPVLLADTLAIPLPFYLLESLRGFDRLTDPWMISGGVAIGLSLLAGLAVDQRGSRVALAALIAVALDACWVSPTSELRKSIHGQTEPALQELATAAPGAVVNYPLESGRAYLYEQTLHGKPVAGTMRQAANEHAMQLLRRIRSESEADPDSFHRAVSSTAERLGIRYLVIHTDPDAEPDVYSKAIMELERVFDTPDWGEGQVRVVPLW